MINQWEASVCIGLSVCSKRVMCEGNQVVVMNSSIPQSSLTRTHNASTHHNFSAIFKYLYPPPQRQPIQPSPPTLPIWRSSTDSKHMYAFISENISILAEPSQRLEPVVETSPFSGKKKKGVRIEELFYSGDPRDMVEPVEESNGKSENDCTVEVLE
jgi:hypothetical protein